MHCKIRKLKEFFKFSKYTWLWYQFSTELLKHKVNSIFLRGRSSVTCTFVKHRTFIVTVWSSLTGTKVHTSHTNCMKI